MQDQWQYRGLAADDACSRTARCRRRSPRSAPCIERPGLLGHRGISGALLRVINVLVKLVTNAGHAQPWFMVDARYLSHGDDPYNQLTKASPPIPSGEILIDQAKFDAWFGAGSAMRPSSRMAAAPASSAVTYLPNYLLHAYCHDQSVAAAHGAGQVFDAACRRTTPSPSSRLRPCGRAWTPRSPASAAAPTYRDRLAADDSAARH